MSRRAKTMNVSRHKRVRLPPKPKFAIGAIVIGIFAGETLAVGVEVATKQVSMWIMMAGGILGLVLGLSIECGRFWWRRRIWHKAQRERAVKGAGWVSS